MEYLWGKSGPGFLDIHCHVLPEIDDGSRSIDESLEMLRRAGENGITEIVTTPHLRSRRFDFGYAKEQLEKLRSFSKNFGVTIHGGAEVNCEALIDFEFKNLDKMCFEGTNVFLLEFKNFALPPSWQLAVRKLQSEGLRVIIAHPERYEFIQRDIGLAEEMVNLGCELQCDAFPFKLGRFDRQKRTAEKLMRHGLVSWIASDAHRPEHYSGFREVTDEYREDILNR